MHIKKTFLSTALFLSSFMIPFASSAQTDFYKHMEGNISQEIHMKADLIRIEDRLTGYYYYYFVDTVEQMDFGIHYGKSLPVTGTFHDGKSLEFKEFADDIEGSVFRGMMENGIIRGDWVSSDGSKTLPFELIETYPEGTIAFYVHHLRDRGTLFDDRQEPVANLDMTLLLPKPYANAAPVDSVNKIIYREFFGLDSAEADPGSILRENRDKFFANYRKANQDIYQEGATSFNWEKQKAVRIQYNEKQILCMEFYDYGFTGGAHGLSLSKFVVVSLDDGHRIHLDEVFREEYRNDLMEILDVQLRKQYEIPDDKDLRDAGFWVEFLEPSGNFYINKDGIGFYYNQYEVAPFAMGPVDVFVPYKKIQWIIDRDGILYQVFGEK